MADVFFPQYLPRRPTPGATPGAGAAESQIAAQSAGALASDAQQASQQGFRQSGQAFAQMSQQLEIMRREADVLRETRSQHWLSQAKQAAQEEIDIYMASPGSDSFTAPENIPTKVGEILSKHYKSLGQQLSNYDDTTRENAAYEYESFAAQTMPGIRHEKTSRIRDEAVAGAEEFVDVKKKEFFKAPTDAERNKIHDSMLGRMEFLRENGFITAEQEEKFQIGLGQDLVNESITQRIGAVTMDTPHPLIAQLYENIEGSSLMPSEKVAQTNALNSHMSYILSEDTRRRTLADQQRKQREEEGLQAVYDTAITGGNLKDALTQLKALRQERIVDTGSYLQHSEKLLNMAADGGGRRKDSDPEVLAQALTDAKLAGARQSHLKTQQDVIDAAAGHRASLNDSDYKTFVTTAMDGIKQQGSDRERVRKDVIHESINRAKTFVQEAQELPGLGLQLGLSADDAKIASNMQRQILRYGEQNPDATEDDVRIFTDGLLLQNVKVVDRLFAQGNPDLFNKSIGLGITTVQGLQNEYKAGRITEGQRNQLAAFIAFRDRQLQALQPAEPGQQQMPAGVPAQQGVTPESSAPTRPKSQTSPPTEGKGRLQENWKTMTEAQRKEIERKAKSQGIGGYLQRLKDYLWSDEQSGNQPAPGAK